MIKSSLSCSSRIFRLSTRLAVISFISETVPITLPFGPRKGEHLAFSHTSLPNILKQPANSPGVPVLATFKTIALNSSNDFPAPKMSSISLPKNSPPSLPAQSGFILTKTHFPFSSIAKTMSSVEATSALRNSLVSTKASLASMSEVRSEIDT